jgi:GNAT superfamily N-acetyltransferase
MIKIRKAIATDAEKISELIYSLMHLFLVEPDGKGAEHFLEMMKPAGLTTFFAQPNINYLLGEEEGVFCGVVAVRNNSHLQHLYIVPAFQGRGVGRYLWETARNQAIAAGNEAGKAGQFTVNAVLSAIPFYHRMGFVSVGDVTLTGGLRCQPMKFIDFPIEMNVPNAATRAAMLEADELVQAHNKRVNAAAAPTGIDWMLQQPLQTGGEAGMSSVSILQERIKGD